MSEQISEEELNEFHEFMEHPWVQAAKAGVNLQPIPTSVGLEPYDFEIQKPDGTNEGHQAALLTIIDPTGVKTSFLSPQLVAHLVALGTALLENWSKQPAKGLIIPNAHQASQAKTLHDQQTQIRRS